MQEESQLHFLRLGSSFSRGSLHDNRLASHCDCLADILRRIPTAALFAFPVSLFFLGFLFFSCFFSGDLVDRSFRNRPPSPPAIGLTLHKMTVRKNFKATHSPESQESRGRSITAIQTLCPRIFLNSICNIANSGSFKWIKIYSTLKEYLIS